MSETIKVGGDWQLLIDELFFEVARGVRLRINPPRKAEPVLWADRPWEETVGSATVFREGDRFRMWYNAIPTDWEGGFANDPRGARCAMCYAESTDGIHWEKPDLDLFAYDGKKPTNIVMPGTHGTVIRDPKGKKDEQYKFFGGAFNSAVRHWPQELEGITQPHRGYVFTSPDGLRWKRCRPAAIPFFLDTQNVMIYDERIDKYVAYVRAKNFYGRAVARAEVDDPTVTPWPCDYPMDVAHLEFKESISIDGATFPIVLSADDLDPADTDLYNPSLIKYRNVYLAFPMAYRHYPDSTLDVESENYKLRRKGAGYANDGPLSVQMATSRDGIRFHRIDRTPYVPLGHFGGPEGGLTFVHVGLLDMGEELYQYYTGSKFTHGRTGKAGDPRECGIRLLVQEQDRFMGAEAGPEGGFFTTPPLDYAGKRLQLNANCDAMGAIMVELAQPDGKAIPGFTFADCDGVDMNVMERTVTWKRQARLPDMQGVSLRLRFRLRSAKLYAFRFAEAEK